MKKIFKLGAFFLMFCALIKGISALTGAYLPAEADEYAY